MTDRIIKKVATSRRLAHKDRTTQVLRKAALDLFLAQGYDATTTDQIAAKAGVSVRTFFRYFDTKEEVLFKGQRSWSEAVANTVMDQPDSLSSIQAMRNALLLLASGLDRDALIRYEKIVESSAALRGRSELQHSQNAHQIAKALATRQGLDGPDAECELMGAVYLVLFRQAVDDVRHGMRDASIEHLVAEKFEMLCDILKK